MKHVAIALTALIFFSSFQSEPSVSELNQVVDGWHKSAAAAHLDSYFAAVTDDFIFLGTDPKERWTKDEFKAFCKPYFDAGKAWDFKPKERNWVFSKNNKVAWFDEKLDTWMEECRGSGIMVKEGNKWKLAYYNLTVVIENEKIKPFIELRKQ
jgi:ketosteroid isomerase-like protein